MIVDNLNETLDAAGYRRLHPETRYIIIRNYFDDAPRIIKRGMILEQAQEHCRNPETSSSTATNPDEPGRWFDGYDKE